jgi:hypothetical protein
MSSDTPQLGSLTVPRRGPRFVGLPLGKADAVTLLLFAEALADLYQEMVERQAGRPISCELVTEIRNIVDRAEQAAKVEVLQVLGEVA